MATRGDRKVGLSFAGAGIGIIGVAFVFGLTTDTGGADWAGIITAIAGVIMTLSGLFRAFRRNMPHAA